MLKSIMQLKDRILDNAVMFNFVRNITDSRNQNLDIIKKELNAAPNEKVLDIGCGLGNFNQATDGPYIGVDLNKSFINFANKNYSNKNKNFVIMDVTKLKFKNKSFDKSMFISMLHHFSDKDSDRILKEAGRVTKKYLVLLDLLPTKRLLANFLYKMDRGSNIRPLEDQFRLVKKYFKVIKYRKFDALMSRHSLMVCRPLK
ncbi:MAG: class I SAM-dependent methyltransferase [Flavobacteriales bacterium]|jgi:ubiquinone/menaquinone biosynthesis C-methylase UbiE|nr:class I SAM-dependent methyltransferase [Flavobacteriales bacterium]|tara:strand:+ start:1109 stop:1711 length:603 start_codon:yes stop_codon:yes gene_type:complete